MSDHIADAGKMIELCAWCRNAPIHPGGIYYCGCFSWTVCNTLDQWNHAQQRILAQRQKDRAVGAVEALQKLSDWALDCMEGEGPEAFEAYENCHVTAENLKAQYLAKERGEDGK